MKYKHYSIFKRGVLHWLSDADLDYMANNEGWLLVTKLVDGDTTEYIFRKEVQDSEK